MQVFIIQRGKTKHCGARTCGHIKIFSLCNRVWDERDVVTEEHESEVTCKRCQKIMAKAKNGVVTL